ncbi:MAG: hypothetical protein ACR2IJ_03430 [Fluviibacter sp.]
MTTTINASPSNGIVQTADGSGVMKLQSNGVTTNALAWANWNGYTAVTVGATYNVSSITRVSGGIYTIAFTNAMANTNYAMAGSSNNTTNMYGVFVNGPFSGSPTLKTTTQLQVTTVSNGGTADCAEINVVIFGT